MRHCTQIFSKNPYCCFLVSGPRSCTLSHIPLKDGWFKLVIRILLLCYRAIKTWNADNENKNKQKNYQPKLTSLLRKLPCVTFLTVHITKRVWKHSRTEITQQRPNKWTFESKNENYRKVLLKLQLPLFSRESMITKITLVCSNLTLLYLTQLCIISNWLIKKKCPWTTLNKIQNMLQPEEYKWMEVVQKCGVSCLTH